MPIDSASLPSEKNKSFCHFGTSFAVSRPFVYLPLGATSLTVWRRCVKSRRRTAWYLLIMITAGKVPPLKRVTVDGRGFTARLFYVTRRAMKGNAPPPNSWPPTETAWKISLPKQPSDIGRIQTWSRLMWGGCFCNLRPQKAPKKAEASTGFETMTSAMPVRCSTDWAMKPRWKLEDLYVWSISYKRLTPLLSTGNTVFFCISHISW